MLRKFVRIVGGDPNKREIEEKAKIAVEINALETQYESLSGEALSGKTDEFRARLEQGETLDDIMSEAFAVVREASKRTLGLRHFDIQMIGGITLHEGKIAEMKTGEGKTLVATLPLYLNALTGKGVHLVTVNDYLARRDARWMAPIFNMLGLSVGVLQMAARTENGKKAFIVDLERESPHEDQHQLLMVPRREAYAADITYGTNSEFGFDYLRDNMTMHMEGRVQRGHHFAIVDEVDNVLIDEARTPLIISGPAQDEAEWYIRMAQVVKALRPEDYEIQEKDRTVTLTEIGEVHVEEVLGVELRDPDRPEDVTLEQARLIGYLEQALRAQFLYKRNKEYLVQAGKVVIVDDFTGRLMPGRRWSDGLHQAVEAKEGVRVQSESVTYATITIQNYFRMYEKLSGMTGTAVTEAEEFDKIYQLGVLAISTNLEYQASRPETGLVELEGRDESNYKYTFYAREDDPNKEEVFWKRKDYPDIVYRTEEAKLRALAWEVLRYNAMGRPILVGTTSVELSDRVSGRLRPERLRLLTQVMLLREVWMRQNERVEDGRMIPELQFLNAPLDKLSISDMRSMARELGLSFNPEDPANVQVLLEMLDLSEQDKERLITDLKAGISHQVLNARKHTEESQIITGAGAFGAVTIATNMAGRGVDIKLGGELAEEVFAAIHRILTRAGYENSYDMSLEERRKALLSLDPSEYGIYEGEVKYFLNYIEEMEQVRALGGLHVIGSERHEARRIDNQLRGRSARQGDPGSSRFYLSMEDELMRLFGGQQADALMQRMKIDDALPLEVGLVSRLVEQSQTRVEGANFDVRKHLLEYDDVLNSQRAKIYEQRDRIFVKDDLTDDVTEMLRAEVLRRVPEALEDEGGPWRLLSWLNQVQPSLNFNGLTFPSFSISLMLEQLINQLPEVVEVEDVREVLLSIARNSLETEKEHLVQIIYTLLQGAESRLDMQLSDRLEALDIFFEGLSLADETDIRGPAELVAELSNTVHLPVKLSPQEQRTLRDDPEEIEDALRDQVENALFDQTITRLVGTVERRLEEPLELDPNELTDDDWSDMANQVLAASESILNRRIERFLGKDGHISRDLDKALPRIQGPWSEQLLLQLLLVLPQGARATFDKKTHRRVWQRTTRLNFIYYSAQILEGREAEQITDQVLKHLEKAQEVMRQAWGMAEWNRVANNRFSDLDDSTREGLVRALEAEENQLMDQRLSSLTGEQRQTAIDELGRRALTHIYRQLLLSVTTELWVEYLTQMEALRVSIGLEAYAQRDPLVQYKSRASSLFQELLNNMRLSVVTRMFTYQPRDLSSVQAGVSQSDESLAEPLPAGAESNSLPTEAAQQPATEKRQDEAPQKKKRRRRR